MTDDDGRITEDDHTVISLCEPSVQVSLRLVAFFVTFIIFMLSKLTSINQTIQYIEHEKDQRKHYPGGFINLLTLLRASSADFRCPFRFCVKRLYIFDAADFTDDREK